MAYIVQKFGGTSLASLELIKSTAQRVKEERDGGANVVVVVSAMAGVTDTLLGYVRGLSSTYDRSEYDTVVSSGEQITAGLLSLALQNLGVPSRSFMGWQIPIYTSSQHSQAQITKVDSDNILACFSKGITPVIAGFQGVTHEGRISTLGRGGSDTTAVAIAAALNADRCDIYTDVDGIYTADPRYVSSADKLEQIAYHEMLELATQGAKVLHKDSVEYAMKFRVPLRVLSSLGPSKGTLVTAEGDLHPHKRNIRGLAHSLAEHKITIKSLPSAPRMRQKFQQILAQEKIEVDFFSSNFSHDTNLAHYSFTVPKTESDRAVKILKDVFPINEILIDNEVAKVSVIGIGLINDYSPSHLFFKTLKDEEIDIQQVAASDIKLSVLIHSEDLERAIASLHTIYQLDTKEC